MSEKRAAAVLILERESIDVNKGRQYKATCYLLEFRLGTIRARAAFAVLADLKTAIIASEMVLKVSQRRRLTSCIRPNAPPLSPRASGRQEPEGKNKPMLNSRYRRWTHFLA
jgi:hypothetical protein